MSALAKYLVRTTLIGGVVGAAHGAVSLPVDTPNRGMRIALQAQLGGAAGPWSPVLGALALQGTLGRETLMQIAAEAKNCPFVGSPPPPPVAAPMVQPDLPTVAEAR